MKKNAFNSIMFNEKFRKDVFRYAPELVVNKHVTREEKEILYPIVEDTIKNKTTWVTLPEGLTMDQDSCLIKFFKYAEGKRIYEYVHEQTKCSFDKELLRLFSKDQIMTYPFNRHEIINALVVHVKKHNIDFMTLRYKNNGNQEFKSIWDKISET